MIMARPISVCSPLMPISRRNINALAGELQYIDHRGMAGVFPEETMLAYKASASIGARFIECDCHLLADGSLGVMHDTAVDRTTTSTGNVADLTQMAFQRLVVDCSSWFSANYADTVPAVFDDVCREFANKVILIPEAKNTGSGAKIVETLQKYGVAKNMAIVQSFIDAELTEAVSAGYPAMRLIAGNYAGTPSAATLLAAGYTWVGIHGASTTDKSYADTLRSAGIKVSVYTLDRVSDCAAWLSHCDAIWSDHSGYLRGDNRSTKDPFKAQVPWPGFLPGNNNGLNSGKGAFYSPDKWGNDLSSANTWYSMLFGWACPLASPTNMVINFTITYTSAFATDRIAGIGVLTDDVAYFTDSAGYYAETGYGFFCKKNGELAMYRYNGSSNTLIASKTTGVSTITDGSSATFKVTVTPTDLTFERTDVAYSCTVSDATYRGAYLHALIKGVFAKYSGITIT